MAIRNSPLLCRHVAGAGVAGLRAHHDRVCRGRDYTVHQVVRPILTYLKFAWSNFGKIPCLGIDTLWELPMPVLLLLKQLLSYTIPVIKGHTVLCNFYHIFYETVKLGRC